MPWFARVFEKVVVSELAASGTEYAVLLSLIIGPMAGGLAILGTNGRNAYQMASSQALAGTGAASPTGNAGSTGPVPASVSKSVFADSFTNAKTSAALWDFNSSKWKVDDGSLHAGPVSSSTLIACANNSNCQNPTISMNATLNQGSGYGVLFDLSGDMVSKNVNGYSFQYDAGWGTGAFTLYKYVNGVQITPPLEIAYPAANYQWDGVNRQISVQQQGSVITAKVDGKTVLTCSDNSYTSGGIGLRLWGNPSATFQNFSVSSSSSR